jgi:hypothetical protein
MSDLIHPKRGPKDSGIGQIVSVAYHRNGIGGEGFYRVEFDETEYKNRLVAVVLEPESDERLGAIGVFVISPDCTDAWRGDQFADALRSIVKRSKWRHQVLPQPAS